MEVFRDLSISADASRMGSAIEEIERSLPSGWAREKEAERRAAQAFVVSKPRATYCFSCQAEGRRSAAMLILTQKDSGTFYVSNVVPLEKHQLSHAEYNAVIEEFYQRIMQPYAERAGLMAELSGTNVGLEHWMSAATAEKLQRFSHCANRGTGSSHPNDRDRWNDFVLAAHRDNSRLDSSTLKRWLVEVDGWAPEVAEQLAVEYQYGRELLSFADGQRRSA